MKKMILVCFLFGALTSVAQSSHEENSTTSNRRNCAFTMADGKMMMVVDGKRVIMDKEMKTKDGVTVMVDGTVKSSNGKSVKMKNGDCMDMTGKMIWVDNDQIDNKNHKE